MMSPRFGYDEGDNNADNDYCTKYHPAPDTTAAVTSCARVFVTVGAVTWLFSLCVGFITERLVRGRRGVGGSYLIGGG